MVKDETIENVLTRRVAKILPSKEGLASLMQKKKIRLYQGFDPTGSRLHLGHSIGIRKLMEFARLGQEVIFLFGTGTVLVGDPSQRDSSRKLITQEEIEENIKDWKRQVAPLVDFKKVTIKQNGDWLVPLTLRDIIKIASNVSAIQLFKREMFQRRIGKGDTVWFHETMYPLLQGYDSVAMDVDLEIGGTDQEFNMLIGRELQKKMNSKEKYVMTVPMIMGTDGKQMSKTTGNCIWLNDTAEDMFGKVMSMPDENIVPYLELTTSLPIKEVGEIERQLKAGRMNPKHAKEMLARELVKDFHGKAAAEQAAKEFARVFAEKKQPEQIPGVQLKEKELALMDLLVKTKLAASKSEARRVILQKGVKINDAVQTDPSEIIALKKGTVVQVGPRRFVKIA